MRKQLCPFNYSIIITLLLLIPGLAQAACEELNKLKLPAVTITLAEAVSAGEFVAPEGYYAGDVFNVPAFCRIQGVAKPTAASQIGFEVWMPSTGWTGRYHQAAPSGLKRIPEEIHLVTQERACTSSIWYSPER